MENYMWRSLNCWVNPKNKQCDTLPDQFLARLNPFLQFYYLFGLIQGSFQTLRHNRSARAVSRILLLYNDFSVTLNYLLVFYYAPEILFTTFISPIRFEKLHIAFKHFNCRKFMEFFRLIRTEILCFKLVTAELSSDNLNAFWNIASLQVSFLIWCADSGVTVVVFSIQRCIFFATKQNKSPMNWHFS